MRKPLMYAGLAAVIGTSVSMGTSPSSWSDALGGILTAGFPASSHNLADKPFARRQSQGPDAMIGTKVVSIGGFLAGGSGMAVRRLSRASESLGKRAGGKRAGGQRAGMDFASPASAHEAGTPPVPRLAMAAVVGQTRAKRSQMKYELAGNDHITI